MSYRSKQTQMRVLDGIKQCSGWVNASTVAAKAGVGHKTARQHLRELNDRGLVEERQTIINRRVCEYRYVGLPEWFVDS